MKTRVVSFVLCLAACSEKASEPAAAPQQPPPVVAAAPAKTEIVVPNITISAAPEDVAKGEEVFTAKGCPACHKVGAGKLVGPDLKGVTQRRDEKWIAKMILRPDVMV